MSLIFTIIHTHTQVRSSLMKTERQYVYRYTTTAGKVAWLLAPNLEHAAWSATELSKPDQLKDVILDDYEW